MTRSRYHIIAIAVLAVACSPSVFSQHPADADRESRPVVLTATVTTGTGHHAMGLRRDAFQVIDEKTPRPIDYFEAGDYPASIGVLIDTSNSVLLQPKRLEMLGVSLKELFEAGHQNNEYLLAAFDVGTRFLGDWKSAAALASEKLSIGQHKQNTAMYDAGFQILERLGTAKYERRALIVISDGQDNSSHHTFKQLRELLKKTDVVLYGILVTAPADVGSSLSYEGEGVLSELAKLTGGEVFAPQNQKELTQVFNTIGAEIRHQYRIGFQIEQSQPRGKWRKLKLRVTPPANAPLEFKKLSVRFRSGYYPP